MVAGPVAPGTGLRLNAKVRRGVPLPRSSCPPHLVTAIPRHAPRAGLVTDAESLLSVVAESGQVSFFAQLEAAHSSKFAHRTAKNIQEQLTQIERTPRHQSGALRVCRVVEHLLCTWDACEWPVRTLLCRRSVVTAV